MPDTENTQTTTYTLHVPDGVSAEELQQSFKTLGLLSNDGKWSLATTNTDNLIKVGRRNSRSDLEMLQQIHDHASALGALCMESNLPADDGKDTKAHTSNESLSEIVKGTGLSLDTIVGAVQNAFWDIREQMRMAVKPYEKQKYDWWEWDDSRVPRCIAVYADHAIARVQLSYWQVGFTIDQGSIVLAPQSEWVEVEQDWITKNFPQDVLDLLEDQDHRFVKALGSGRLGNYLVIWGDDENRDLTGEYFTKSTEGLTTIFDTIGKIPALYHHGMDKDAKYEPIGVIDVMKADDIGLWTETQLDLANKYAVAVEKLAKKKKLGASSGTLPAARKVSTEGEIQKWVIIEGSFTVSPCDSRTRQMGVNEMKALYEEVGLEVPDLILSDAEPGTGDGESRTDVKDIEMEQALLDLLELEHSCTTLE